MINKNISKMFEVLPPPSTEELQGSGLSTPASVRLSARAELRSVQRAVAPVASVHPTVQNHKRCMGCLQREESP
jgi:hypothetical protein